MTDDNEKIAFWVGVIGFPAMLGVVVLGVVLGAYVLETLWNWFAPPFTAVRLGFAEALGLTALISHLKGYRYRKNEDGWKSLLNVFVGLGLTLLIGWVAHLGIHQ